MDFPRHAMSSEDRHTASPGSDSYSVRLRRLSQGVRARLMNRPFSCDIDSLCPSAAASSSSTDVGLKQSLLSKFRHRAENVASNGTKDAHEEFTFGSQLDGTAKVVTTASKRKGSIKERFLLFTRAGQTAGDRRVEARSPLARSVSQMELEATASCGAVSATESAANPPPPPPPFVSLRSNGNTPSLSFALLTTVRPSKAAGSSSVDSGCGTSSINVDVKQEQPSTKSTATPLRPKQQQQLIVDAYEIDYACDRFTASRGHVSNHSIPSSSYLTVTNRSATTFPPSFSSERDIRTVVDQSEARINNNAYQARSRVGQDGRNGSSLLAKQTLKRAQAVDLSSSDVPQPYRPFSSADSQEQQSKRLLRKELKKGALRKPSHESILRKLILASGKAFSEDSSLRIMNSVASMVSRMENSEVSSGSMEEQRGRKQFFAHYDCHSICADYGPLLSQAIWKSNSGAGLPYGPGSGPIGPLGPFGSAPSRVCLPQRNTTNPCGGSLDVLSVPSPIESDDHGVTSSAGSSAMLDEGDGKYNGLILSCPFFRNEIGGEPTRHVSLGTERYLQRWIVQDVSSAPTSDPSVSAASRSAKAKDSTETWHRIPSAAEACVLENLGNVYLGGRLCAYRQPQLVIEHVDHGAFYYRHCFLGKAHQNYFGIDENLGPVAVSITRDKLDAYQAKQAGLVSPYLYRMIVRLSDLSTFRGSVLEESLPSYQIAKEQMQAAGQPLSPTGAVGATGQTTSLKIPVKELLELVVSDLLSGCLRLAVPLPRTEEMLLKLDEQTIYTRYKVGVLLCKAGQCSEEQMYNNEHSSAPFEEFLDILGQRIRLKGFDKYRGGLDNKGDSTGTHSVYTSYQQYEIMFHVSTMLPFTPSNRQQLARKRHIGNDIVTIIFQEPGALPFCPQTMRSHFQHVFIVVQAVNPNTDKVKYSVSVSRYKDVPAFGPPIPENYGFPRSQEFREFLLTKVINAENAVHVSAKFAAMAARTRREFMRELAENHCISHSIESSSAKITSKILGNKRKDRPRAKVFLEAFNRGAIVWDVQVLTELENFSLCCTVDCFLAISADYLVMIERSTETTLFCTATHSVIGWTLQGNSLKLYYDHADVIILRTVDDDDGLIIADIITRLKFVTKGCETQEMMLRQSGCESLDFRIQYEGIVSDVDMYGHSWQAGLRQGSRIVEICKVSVASLTYPKMIEFLKSPNSRVLVIAPLEDGSPRRGCEDPHCPAVRGEVTPIVPSDWVSQPGSLPLHLPGRSPPSYDSLVTRPRVGTDLEGVSSSCKGALKVHGSGNDLCPNNCSSKSLDELRSRRAHCYSDTAAGLDSGFDSTRNSADYQSTTASSLSSEDRWYQSLMLQSTVRTKNLSSSSSGGSSDLSSEAAVQQGKMDTTLLHPQAGVGNLVIGSRNLPLNISGIGSDKGALGTVPAGVGSTAKLSAFRAPPTPANSYKHRSSDTSMVTLKGAVSSQQDMLSISDSDASKETISLADTNSARPFSPGFGAKYWSSRFADVPSTSSDLTKCSSLVDLATRAIEGVTQMAVSQQGSPELTSYNLVLQASRRKIVLLEERVKHLLTELSGERESKRHLEAEVSRLNDENKALSNELKAAKEELQHFTQWFHSTVENPMAYLQEPVLNDRQ